MVVAAIIRQVGKVELREVPPTGINGAPPSYLTFYWPKKFSLANMLKDDSPTSSFLDMEIVKLRIHRVVGFPFEYGYWPDTWQNSWAVTELIKFIDPDGRIYLEFVEDYIVQENRPGQEDHPNGVLELEKPFLMIEEKPRAEHF
jgi:hypothetical protein